MTKTIKLQKNDDGSFEILDGCSMEEFNEGGGLTVTNLGKRHDGSIEITVRVQNNLPGCDSYYRLRMDVPSEERIEDISYSIGQSLLKTCKSLFGAEDYKNDGSSTYKEFDTDYQERCKEFNDIDFDKRMIDDGFIKHDDGVWWKHEKDKST